MRVFEWIHFHVLPSGPSYDELDYRGEESGGRLGCLRWVLLLGFLLVLMGVVIVLFLGVMFCLALGFLKVDLGMGIDDEHERTDTGDYWFLDEVHL